MVRTETGFCIFPGRAWCSRNSTFLRQKTFSPSSVQSRRISMSSLAEKFVFFNKCRRSGLSAYSTGLQDAAWPLFEQWQIMGKLQAFLPFPATTFMGCYELSIFENLNGFSKSLHRNVSASHRYGYGILVGSITNRSVLGNAAFRGVTGIESTAGKWQ